MNIHTFGTWLRIGELRVAVEKAADTAEVEWMGFEVASLASASARKPHARSTNKKQHRQLQTHTQTPSHTSVMLERERTSKREKVPHRQVSLSIFFRHVKS